MPVDVYEPPVRVRPSGALRWIHGGGFVIGHPMTFFRTSMIAARRRSIAHPVQR